jgi:hypothetical protein
VVTETLVCNQNRSVVFAKKPIAGAEVDPFEAKVVVKSVFALPL